MRRITFTFLLSLSLSSGVLAQIDDRGYPSPGTGSIDDFSFGARESYLTSDVEIPPVSDRREGPSIEVTEFQFDQLPEFPELGITKQTVGALVEDLRQKFSVKEGELDSGLTEIELQEIAVQLPPAGEGSAAEISVDDLEQVAEYLLSISEGAQSGGINDYEVEGLSTLISGLPLAELVNLEAIDRFQVSELVKLTNRQRADRGLSYIELEKVASEITLFYRQRGVFLAKAYIPVQQVENGVVKLNVLAGVLGQVNVQGNEKYSADKIKSPLMPYIGKGISSEQVEEALYIINSFPGLDAYGYFSAGENVGETALNLQVAREKSYQLTVSADNYGSVFTGDNRLLMMFDWFNPTGRGDTLSLGFLKSWEPLNSDVGVFQYRAPLWGDRTYAYVAADYNEFAIDGDGDATIDALGIDGTNSSYTLGVDHQFTRLRTLGLNAGFAITEKETEVDSLTQLLDAGERVQGAQFNLSFDAINESWRLLTIGQMTVQYGEFKEGADTILNQDEEFYKFALDLSTLKFFELPFSDIESRIILKSKFRYSEQDLPAFEQLPLGGADAVRAFTVSQFSADQSVYLGGEWYIEMPKAWDVEFDSGATLNQMLDFAFFVDGAYGSNNLNDVNGQEINDTWVSLGGVGVLFRFSWREVFSTQVSFSHPVSSKASPVLDGVPLDDGSRQGFGNDVDNTQTFIEFTFVY